MIAWSGNTMSDLIIGSECDSINLSCLLSRYFGDKPIDCQSIYTHSGLLRSAYTIRFGLFDDPPIRIYFHAVGGEIKQYLLSDRSVMYAQLLGFNYKPLVTMKLDTFNQLCRDPKNLSCLVNAFVANLEKPILTFDDDNC